LQGKFKHRHEEKMAEAAAEQAKEIVATYWKKNVFNPVNCCFYDEVKEAEYIRAKEEDVRLRQGRSNLSKLPPTLANSVSLMYVHPLPAFFRLARAAVGRVTNLQVRHCNRRREGRAASEGVRGGAARA